MIIKTKGIVIRSIDFQETSKIVTVLTADHGKVALLAKGARSPKSQYGHAIQVMNELEIVYYYKTGRDIQNLSQTENLVKRNHLLTNYDVMMMGFKLLEWINKLHIPDHESTALFQLLSRALSSLDSQENINDGLYPKFLLRISQILGYEPNYTECASCNRQFPTFSPDEMLGIAVTSGQLYCGNCAGNQKMDYRVSIDVAAVVNRWLFPSYFKDLAVTVSRENYQTVQMIMERHVSYHLDVRN